MEVRNKQGQIKDVEQHKRSILCSHLLTSGKAYHIFDQRFIVHKERCGAEEKS